MSTAFSGVSFQVSVNSIAPNTQLRVSFPEISGVFFWVDVHMIVLPDSSVEESPFEV